MAKQPFLTKYDLTTLIDGMNYLCVYIYFLLRVDTFPGSPTPIAIEVLFIYELSFVLYINNVLSTVTTSTNSTPPRSSSVSVAAAATTTTSTITGFQ